MRLSTFSSTKFIVIGAMLIFGGFLSISLGIPSATPANRSYPYGHLGYGIWMGTLYVIVGILNIIVGCKTSPELVIWAMVMNIACCVLGVLQMALGVSAANQDFSAMWLRYQLSEDAQTADKQVGYELAAFYQEFFPMTYKIATSKNMVPFLHNGVVAVDSLLAIAGIFVAFISAMAAASACRVICCPNLTTDLDTVTVVSAVPHEGRQKSTHQMHENIGFQGAP